MCTIPFFSSLALCGQRTFFDIFPVRASASVPYARDRLTISRFAHNGPLDLVYASRTPFVGIRGAAKAIGQRTIFKKHNHIHTRRQMGVVQRCGLHRSEALSLVHCSSTRTVATLFLVIGIYISMTNVHRQTLYRNSITMI